MSSPWGRVATPGRRSNGASSAAGRAPECRVRRRSLPRRALARLRSNALPCRFVSGAPLRAAVLVILFFPACISASPLARAASKTAGDWRQVRPIEAPPCRPNHCGLQYAHRAAAREARRHGHEYGCGHMCTCSQERAHTHAAPHTAALATDGTGAGWVPSAVSRCRSGSQKVGRVAEAQGIPTSASLALPSCAPSVYPAHSAQTAAAARAHSSVRVRVRLDRAQCTCSAACHR